ncbi:MAG: tetratricopeptide repeat protein, partial [Candidatus Hodarchaeales archaeon]
EFSLDVVRGLLNLKQTDAAKDYLKFVEDLISKAYQNDDTKRIEKQLTMGDLLGQLGMKDRSKAFIEAALQTIDDPKKREKIVFKYVDELLVSQAALTAQEMINFELARLLNTKKIKDIIKFCCQFIEKLKAYALNDMIFEYMRYIANLMLQTDYSDYDLLLEFTKEMLRLNETDKSGVLLDQLVLIQIKNQDFTRAIDALSRFTEHLLEKTDRMDLVQKYIFETAEAYRKMGDEDGATKLLIKYQTELLDRSVDLSQKLTDIILKEFEEKKDYKKSIEVVSKIIEKQFDAGKYQDAYIFTVQNARYIESSGSITDVIKYLGKMRNKFLEHKQFENASKMTDLIFRFGKTHNQLKLAIQSIKEYAKAALEYEDYGTAIKYALDVANLFEEEKKPGKALEFLQMIFNVTIANETEKSMTLLRKIIEIHSQKSDFKKITRKIIDPLLEKYPDVTILNLVNEVLSPSLEEYAGYAQKFYDNLIDKSSLTPEYANGIISLIQTVYEGTLIDLGDGLVEKYANKLTNSDFIDEANVLMSIRSEKTMKPFSEIIEDEFAFIEGLVTRGLTDKAREVTDNLIQKISSDQNLISEKNKLLPTICERFAHIVASDNPDLASEYVYLASDYLRGTNDFNEIVRIFNSLANLYSDPKRVVRTLKRGIYICSKFNAKKHEAQLLTALTKFYITVADDEVLSTFQKTIERLEELEDLDELFNVSRAILEQAIICDNLGLVYKYLEYSTKLASMINHEEGLGGILVFLLNQAGSLKEKENIKVIKKYIEDLNIKPKKFKKEFNYLSEERTRFIKAQSTLEPLKEDISEPQPITLVDTGSVIPETAELKSEEHASPQVESESELLKVIGELKSETKSPLDDVSPTTPPTRVFEAPDEEITQIEPETVKFGQPEEVLEIPVREDAGKQATTLSDQEVANLFASSDSELEKTVSTTTKIDEDLIGEFATKPESGVTLSDDEIDGLFSKRKEAETEAKKWEVDSFGRLMKKEEKIPTPAVSQKIDYPEVSEEISGTPDLSSLEKTYEKPEEDVFKPTQLKSLQVEIEDSDLTQQNLPDIESLEKALVDTEEITPGDHPIISSEKSDSDLFDKDVTSPFSSFMDALSEDESTDTKDIFGVPEVTYEEVGQQESPKPSEVKPPDLIDLFSDALSELGSIPGDSGKGEKKKKK